MSILFQPLKLRSITLRNRLGISPMCQYSAVDGVANHWHLVHLGSRAVGGAGLVIQDATAVSPQGRISPADLGLYNAAQMEALKPIVEFIKLQGATPGIQLAHAGRKAGCAVSWEGGAQLMPENGGWLAEVPSALPFKPGEQPPLALDADGIQQVVDDFSKAARRAFEAGYEVVEIHAAHGYLIHEFLSPLSNHRTDDYGGSFQNRIRLLLMVVKAVRSEWPARLPLLVRISATDWMEGGWNADESVQLASILKTLEVDMIDCSSGGLVPNAVIPAEPGFQVGFAEQIKHQAHIPVAAVGLITNALQAEEILSSQKADLILIGRASLADPHFPLHAAKVLGCEIKWPLQYLRAK
ncbi:NADH:flavin oxidoreductase/NADH oxidase [Lentimicrobium sp.]